MNNLFKKTALALAMAATFGVGTTLAAEVDTKGGIKVKSDDGQFVGELKGRLHLDAYIFDNDGTTSNEGGSNFRRLRLAGESTMYGVYKGKIEIDFRSSNTAGASVDATDTRIRDAYLQHTAFGPGALTVGQFKTPMGLEELTSSNVITFIERSQAVSAVAPNFRRGLGYSGSTGNISYATMLYGQGFRNATNSEGVGLGGRLTWTPFKDKVSLMHVGLSLAQEKDVQNLSARSSNYEANLADAITLIPALTDAEDQSRYGLEFAYVTGPLSIQAEYLKTQIDSELVGDPEIGGYYVAASYFLTGESRPYRASNGTFDRIKPNDKSGAWEIAARASNLEAEADGTDTNEISNITLGLNYYFNPQIRAMVNLIKSDIDVTPSPGVIAASGDPKTLAFRVQYDF